MTAIPPTASPAGRARGRRLARDAIFTAAIALAGCAIAHPALAHASFNQGDYDQCVKKGTATPAQCCNDSGGS
jgi:hypothetical protein